jgi:hypothetical protein
MGGCLFLFVSFQGIDPPRWRDDEDGLVLYINPGKNYLHAATGGTESTGSVMVGSEVAVKYMRQGPTKPKSRSERSEFFGLGHTPPSPFPHEVKG